MSMSIGGCYFDGPQPSHCFSTGCITIYYDGPSPSEQSIGGVKYYEFYGNVWVVYGHFYPGFPKIHVTTRSGRVQTGYL